MLNNSNQLLSHGPLILTPYPEYKLSARVMSGYHLALALRGVKLIYRRCKYPNPHTDDHEAALWKDDIVSLLDYGLILEAEAKNRGLKIRDAEWIKTEHDYLLKLSYAGITNKNQDPMNKRKPWWVACQQWHLFSWMWMLKQNEKFYTQMAKQVGLYLPDVKEPYNPMDIFKHDCVVDPKRQQTAWVVNVRSVP